MMPNTVLLFFAMYVAGFSIFAHGLTPDPTLQAKDFIIDFRDAKARIPGPGGLLILATAADTPALVNSGLAFAEATLRSGGAIVPHTHGTYETVYVVTGTIRLCFVEQLGGATRCNDLKAGQATFLPAGTIHYIQNPGKTRAKFIAQFPTDSPSTFLVTSGLFTLPLEILSASFNLTTDELAKIRTGLPQDVLVAPGPMAFPAPTLLKALAL